MAAGTFRRARREHGIRRCTVPPRYVGWFFVWTSGVHVGIVAADPQFYRHFADGAVVPGLAMMWRSTFMTHATTGGLLVAAAEAVMGLLLLGDRRWRRLGWLGVIGFHVALMCFGWGFWLWSVPALVVLGASAKQDTADADGPGSLRPMTLVDRGS